MGKIRTRVQNTLQAMALNHALRRGRGLWTATGQKELQALSLPSYTSQRRDELLRLYLQLQRSDPRDHNRGPDPKANLRRKFRCSG